jgi:hypothetical protein
MEASEQLPASATLPTGRNSAGTHWMGWGSPGAGLDVSEEQHLLSASHIEP